MLLNYLKMACKSVLQNTRQSLLNIMGLSIGLAAAMVVALFAQHELSYDKWQPNATNNYRVELDWSGFGFDVFPSANLNRAQAFKNISGVEAVFGLVRASDIDASMIHVSYGEKRIQLKDMFVASDNLNEFAALDVLQGDMAQALTVPWQLALSESEALRVFGAGDIIGKRLNTQTGVYSIAAVFADLPENTHFHFKSLTNSTQYQDDLRTHMHYVYLRLADNATISQLVEQLTDAYTLGPERGRLKVKLSAITDLHLHHISELKPGGKWQTVVLCILLSGLLIGIACFNFVNMSVAQVARRAQETGIRKALGASRTQLVLQILFESWIVTIFSIVLACAIVELSLPIAKSLIGREVILVFGLKEFAALLALSIVVAVLAGLYPALYISSFATLDALSGELSSGQTANRIRKTLLGLQSAFSISLIAAVITFSQQLKLLQDIDTGFATDNRLIISGLPKESVFTKENARLLTRLNQIPNVSLATPLDTKLTHSFLYSFEVRFPNGSQSETPIPAVGVGFRAVESLGLKLIAGRDFSSSTGSDWFQVNEDSATVSTIITESLSQLSGFASPQEAIGQTIQRDNLQLSVVGVVEDIQLGTARENYNQVFFVCGFTLTMNMNVLVAYDKNLSAEQRMQMISAIETTLVKELNIFEPSIRRVEDDRSETLGAERSLLRIISVFSVLVIVLACIGIFGLASFSSQRRMKEVALRKVLGASELSLVNLLAKEYLWLVAASVVLAWPLSYWLLANWLQGFSQRVDQSIWVYLFATFIVAAISWITSASLAFKAAVGHPASALRHE